MKKIFLLMPIVIFILASCTSKKDYLYLADMADGQGYFVGQQFQPRVQIDDRLRISVSCKNPELAVPFNVGTGMVQVAGQTIAGNQSSPTSDNSYRVNNDGDISFPVLGKLHVAGLTLPQVSELIRSRIISGNYIKDPIVQTEFATFRYTVLGAVNSNGTFTGTNDRVSILEAIARAGDLANNADLGQIAVIREEGDKRQVYTIDIRSTDVFNSPAYYLAQNDIIYARPKKPKSESKQNFLAWLTVALSIVTATTSVIWVTKK